MSRPFDIVIYGATGYTAGLTIDYLLTNKVGSAYKWAIAGRNFAKMEALMIEKKKSLPTTLVDPTSIPILVASIDVNKELDDVCKNAVVIISVAGPYIKCGLPIAAACVRNGTHYVDTTGEFQFVRLLIERHHQEAKAKKVLIVPTCGFYSVPSDLGSNMMHEFVTKLSGSPKITQTVGYFEFKKPSLSGGAAASFASIYDTVTAADNSPLSLNPVDARKGVKAPAQRFISYVGGLLKFFAVPHAMAGSDERVVRRTNALLGRPTSTYYETAVSKGLFSAVGAALNLYVLKALLYFGPIRRFVTKAVLPPPGTGPSSEDKKGSGFVATFVSTTDNGVTYKGVWEDKRDAYDLTAVYMVQGAVTILETFKDSDEANDTTIIGGVLTPASAFGLRLLNRLIEDGTSIQVEEINKAK
eukprot:GILI01009099.1.p1 GENE.GILI01009099.1~~GILI01009099.1.p1  ORF type:complete len:436 (+),score=75.33 GILI01009099.1:69-1310(+)